MNHARIPSHHVFETGGSAPRRRTPNGWALAGWLAVAGAAVADESGLSVRVECIDGSSVSGQWLGLEGGEFVRIREKDADRTFPLDELFSIQFSVSEVPRAAEASFFLADGGRLEGELLSPTEKAPAGDAILARTALGERTVLPIRALSAIRLASGDEQDRAAELFAQALENRLPAQDVLISRDGEEAQVVRGTLGSLDAEGGMFRLGDHARSFKIEKIFGVVFASGTGKAGPFPLTMTLADGSMFSGKLSGAADEGLRVASSLGFEVEVDIRNVRRIGLFSPRVAFLSDMEPLSTAAEGILHRPWPVRRDRNVASGPIRLQGREFAKGLGVHSRCELVFRLDRGFETFLATVGIDDAVRPRGSAAFRVTGDGRMLFDSDAVGGDDEPRDVSVDVKGVEQLGLIVDYGEAMDLADYADWGNARLIRPRQPIRRER